MLRWEQISGTYSGVRLPGALVDLPAEVRARGSELLVGTLALFVSGELAGLVGIDRSVQFSSAPQTIAYLTVLPAKGTGGLFILVDGNYVAEWDYSERNQACFLDLARILAKRLDAPLQEVQEYDA